MPVKVRNLPGLRLLDFKEADADYHVKAQSADVSKRCPPVGAPMKPLLTPIEYSSSVEVALVS